MLSKREWKGKVKFKLSVNEFEARSIIAIFEIDFDYPGVIDKIIEMSTFWSDSPDKEAPLERHLEHLLPIATYNIHTAYSTPFGGVTAETLDEYLWNNEDGFAYGKYVGIKLVKYREDGITLEEFDITVL